MDSGDAPGTDAAVDGFVGSGRAAGGIARSCHAGDASNAPVRAAGPCAGRSRRNGGLPVARDFDGNPQRITEADAMIAYLQMLGTLVDFKQYDNKANLR